MTIAGSDPSGGAGIQADLKTFHQLEVFGTAAITLITVQNTTRVSRVETLDGALVSEQIEAVLEDLPPQAVKTGALGTAAIVESAARALMKRPSDCPLVLDPVMISTQGALLTDTDAQQAIERLLLPQAALITPNLNEASRLAGIEVENPAQMREAAIRIARRGGQSDSLAVLVKGGHLAGAEAEAAGALDILYDEGAFTVFPGERIETRHTHGTGCTYSAAITAFLARGFSIPEAVGRAKKFIDAAIRTNPGLGKGAGPLNHWAKEPRAKEPAG